MKVQVAGALALMAAPVFAGGIDATGQPMSFIFAQGTVVELGFGHVSSSVTGNDAAVFGGSATGNVIDDLTIGMASLKHDINEKLSFGAIIETPFAASITYPTSSLAFGGSGADASITSVTAVARYKFSDRFSVFAGPRWQRGDASFSLSGALYGPLSGYRATLSQDEAVGYAAGVAFEIPEYFLRVALTYNSEIEHTFTTTEAVPGLPTTTSQVSVSTPQSLNLEFVSGVAPKTFVFGGARWVEWSKLQFAPPVLSSFSSIPLVDFNDTVTYSLGVGRQVAEDWTLTATFIHEPSTTRFTTPLTPTDGFTALSLGAIYSNDGFELHGNLTYTELGDTTPFVGTPLNTTVASFSGNSSLAAGVKIVKRF